MKFVAYCALLVGSVVSVAAQHVYERPPETLAQLVDAPSTPAVRVSPDGRTLLMLYRPNLPSIDELAQSELRLAGIRINPANNGPSRSSYYTQLVLMTLGEDGERRVTGHPEAARIRNVQFSPDGSKLAYTVDFPDQIQLFVADVATAKGGRVGDFAVNDIVSGSPYRWFADNNSMVVVSVPADRGAAPVAPLAPLGPVIQENIDGEAPARTYQDLLQNPYDEDLYRHYMLSELLHVTTDGMVQRIGEPGLIAGARPSPDGRYVLIERQHEPFSYLVPAYRFARSYTVHRTDGSLVREIARLPVADNVPTAFGSVPAGPRSVQWRSDVPATLAWVEAQDGGDARVEAEVRDRVFMLAAPFGEEPTGVVSLSLRYAGITWGDSETALVRESWYSTRQTRTFVIRPSDPAAEPRLLFDYSMEDRYADPGYPLLRTTPQGTSVMRLESGKTIMTGLGFSPDGTRPFLRSLDLVSGETEELFRSVDPYYERPIALVGDGRLLTRRETTTEPPNIFIRDLATGAADAVSTFAHPYPDLADVQKVSLQYTRDDGVLLTATLYLPSGYDADVDGPLPGLVWAYPQEFKSAQAAGQRADSPNRFKRISYWGAIPYVTQGYAVLDDVSMPVIGEGEAEPNDTFREQLVANAAAAIAEGVRRGVLDPDRVAVGGHSYGAFMTANLLAHSDLFRAGIARSGAYNRTLTPFGFQAEERLFWEAPELYFDMSPFMHADKVDEPVLLIHGEADNNSGTFPLQSRRYYGALKGLGKTVRLVMLPHESHGYRARESVLHMLWETDRWLERHVKDAPPRVRVDGPTG